MPRQPAAWTVAPGLTLGEDRNEMCHKDDIEHSVRLLVAYLEG